MDCEELAALALGALDGEQLLVVAFVLDGFTEREIAEHLTELRGCCYDRERVHRVRRSAFDRMRRTLALAGVRA
jgi:hypothetical protein